MQVMVVDNFMLDPDAVRRDALAMPFEVEGNYPGRRTVPYHLDIRHAFESLLGRPVESWHSGRETYNGAFQVILADDQDSWIHHDSTRWAAVLHLSPRWPPGHGTVFYRRLDRPAIVRHEPGQDDWNEVAHEPREWVESMRVEGAYNRLVLYDAMMYHRSGLHGFGHSPETGRLTQVWFFD